MEYFLLRLRRLAQVDAFLNLKFHDLDDHFCDRSRRNCVETLYVKRYKTLTTREDHNHVM